MFKKEKNYTLIIFFQGGAKISTPLPYGEVVRYIADVTTKKLQASKGHFTFKNNDSIITLRHKTAVHYFIVSNDDEIITEYDNIPGAFLSWTINNENVL